MSSKPRASRQLRVKLKGAGNFTRQIHDALGVDQRDDSPATSEASPAGHARVERGEAAHSDAFDPAKVAFEPGSKALLVSGRTRYEVEVLHEAANIAAPTKKASPSRRAKPSAATVAGYQFRYLKWPRRADEWAAAVYFVPWSAALATSCSSRPPRKNMWTSGKPLADDSAAEEETGDKMEVDDGMESGDGEDEKDSRRSFKGARSALAADEAGRKRMRKPSDKLHDDPAPRSKTPISEGGDVEETDNAHADVLMGLFAGGGGEKSDDEDGEEDEQEEDEEMDSDEEGEDDDDDDDDDDMGKPDEEEMNEHDDEEDFGRVLNNAERRRSAVEDRDRQRDAPDHVAAAASTHKRKSVPVKSLPASDHAPQWHNHDGQMKMLLEQVHAQTKAIDAVHVIAPANQGKSNGKGQSVVRCRKSSCPLPSL
ncbi:hypothetical protein AB1Y20_018387 [Prymnesium parvum]|uniref:Transcription initiation factor IIF subunit alpha n=1 Tax=Prymnesium parvum TaxID=97485 RepID=A0AB34JRH8_PRYPA